MKSRFVLPLLALLAAAPAQAAYFVDVVQSGTNVVATGSGSLNFNAFTNHILDVNLQPEMVAGAQFSTQYVTEALLGASARGDIHVGVNIASGSPLMGTGNTVLASAGTGNLAGFQYGLVDGADAIYVPLGYVSGSDLGTSTATWNNTTIAGLGLNPGTYQWTWGSGATADSFTVRIAAPAVPEPATWAMMLAGFGLLGSALRRRATKVAFA